MDMNKALLTGESLLDRLRDPNVEMSFGDKLAASLQVTVLGVVIVVLALVLLYYAINIMEKLLQPQKTATKTAEEKTAIAPATASAEEQENQQGAKDQDNEELIAVITAAIAASLETSTHNIVVRNIVRTADHTPAWGKAGRMEQINQMYRV